MKESDRIVVGLAVTVLLILLALPWFFEACSHYARWVHAVWP